MSERRIHQPCPFEDCGSSDAATFFADGGVKCFSCGQSKKGTSSKQATQEYGEVAKKGFAGIAKQLQTSKYVGNTERGLTAKTMEFYSALQLGEKTVYGYYAPDDKNTPLASKTRLPGKKFPQDGELKACGLFGQQLWSGEGKSVTVTEGEDDAMAAYQMQGSKYPCVSIRNGADGAAQECKDAYDWLNSFERIVFSFDDDEKGRKAVQQCAAIFGPKAHIMSHSKGYKDACDYNMDGKKAQYVRDWWDAAPYSPPGIIDASTLWDLVNEPVQEAMCQYPWAGLNEITYGIREEELITVCAGSGLGKSQFLREIIYHLKTQTDEKMGLLFLEESVKKTALSLMSLWVKKLLHLPTTKSTEEERRDAFENMFGKDTVYLLDKFGSSDVDSLVGRVRYLAMACDCRIIFLDHVSIVVSSQENGDERKAIDEIMTRLRMLVQETGIALVLVSHLKRPSSQGHEEGAVTSLSQLRGSASIGQLSDMVIGLERDGQNDDPIIRNTTTVRVLKNRFSGETGKACDLLFSKDTGRMAEYFVEDAL